MGSNRHKFSTAAKAQVDRRGPKHAAEELGAKEPFVTSTPFFSSLKADILLAVLTQWERFDRNFKESDLKKMEKDSNDFVNRIKSDADTVYDRRILSLIKEVRIAYERIYFLENSVQALSEAAGPRN